MASACFKELNKQLQSNQTNVVINIPLFYSCEGIRCHFLKSDNTYNIHQMIYINYEKRWLLQVLYHYGP